MFYFAKFRRRNFAYGALWLVSQMMFTNIKRSVDCVVDVGFRKFISSVKSADFRTKNLEIFLSKLISNVKGASQLTLSTKQSTNVIAIEIAFVVDYWTEHLVCNSRNPSKSGKRRNKMYLQTAVQLLFIRHTLPCLQLLDYLWFSDLHSVDDRLIEDCDIMAVSALALNC